MESADRFVEVVQHPSPAVTLDVAVALIGASFEQATADDDLVEAAVAGLDQLATECEPTFESVLRLFQHHLTGNSVDYGDPRNSYLHEVLHRGTGIPITLSVCAMEVGRRLGLVVNGVGLPGHFLVECDGVYADPFHLGRLITADELEPAWQRMTGIRDRLDPRLLSPVPQRGILLRMLNNLKNTFVAMDEPAPLRTLAKLRSAFPELAHERAEYARWLRHWN
ncbi:MAG: transglutaminase family protein [Ilumatobacteraceae bacterium]